MIATVAFSGFRRELLDFLSELRAHNERDWFQAHYEDYQRYFVEAARAFVLAMGERLPELGAGIHAEPKVRGSIFAINRDIRFSPDKTPYKSHLDLWFWQGDGPSRERPGYFVRLEPERLTLGAGVHGFSDAAQAAYRAALTEPDKHARLTAVLADLSPPYEIGGKTLKRVPSGTDDELLKHTAPYAQTSGPPPPETFESTFPDACMAHFRRLAPLQQWLVDVLPR